MINKYKSAYVVPLNLEDKQVKHIRDYNYYKNLSPDMYRAELELWYKYRTGEMLDLSNPITYNEKIQWIKIYDSTYKKTVLADKLLARQFVKKEIGEKYIVHLIGSWNCFDDIDFNLLPKSFVLKATHGSGWNLIASSKDELDIESAKEDIDFWLSRNFAFNCGFELQYLKIPPKVIAEEYLGPTDELNDYKVMCFGGKAKFLWVDTGRYSGNHRRTFFDLKWNRLNVRFGDYEPAEFEIIKPKNFDEMIRISERLSSDFCHVRVDFYEVNNRLLFGEMTFTPGSGIKKILPQEFSVEMGSWIHIPI